MKATSKNPSVPFEIKSYLRNTMTEVWSHSHQEVVDELDLKIICIEYIFKNQGRKNIFPKLFYLFR